MELVLNTNKIKEYEKTELDNAGFPNAGSFKYLLCSL